MKKEREKMEGKQATHCLTKQRIWPIQQEDDAADTQHAWPRVGSTARGRPGLVFEAVDTLAMSLAPLVLALVNIPALQRCNTSPVPLLRVGVPVTLVRANAGYATLLIIVDV